MPVTKPEDVPVPFTVVDYSHYTTIAALHFAELERSLPLGEFDISIRHLVRLQAALAGMGMYIQLALEGNRPSKDKSRSQELEEMLSHLEGPLT